MSTKRKKETLKDLLEAYLALDPEELLDIEAFSSLLAQRQEIIDRISEIDENLAVLQRTVSDSPDLQDLLSRIADLDKRLLDRALAHKEQLRASLGQTSQGLKAARGYRVHIPSKPSIIDSQA
jgi:predicted RNA-binding protein with EMAP domain